MNYKPSIRTGNVQSASKERRQSLSTLGRELITIIRHPIRYNAAINGTQQLDKMYGFTQTKTANAALNQTVDTTNIQLTIEQPNIAADELMELTVQPQTSNIAVPSTVSYSPTVMPESAHASTDTPEITALRKRIEELTAATTRSDHA